MKKIFSATLLTAVFLAGAIVTAQETPRPSSPPGHMGPMRGMMSAQGPMSSTEHMRAMMAMMQQMQGTPEMAKMMEHCQQAMQALPPAEPNAEK